MNYPKVVLHLCSWCCLSVLSAQADSLVLVDSLPEELVVTATRLPMSSRALSLPVDVVSKEQIRRMGALRLQEVLAEQIGFSLVAEHGMGAQMQGLDADYVQILIDGEPVVGRTAGTLELSRLAVGNVERVEIVKGATSSLYGSEALAGVINLITDEGSNGRRLSIQARYGSLRTADFSLQGSWATERWRLRLFVNRHSTRGYDLDTSSFGQTIEPYYNYTTQLGATYNFSERLRLRYSSRGFWQEQQNQFMVGFLVQGATQQQEYANTLTLEYQPNKKWQTQTRLYHTYYAANTKLLDEGQRLWEESFFRQHFFRIEQQAVVDFSTKQQLLAGIGYAPETVFASRYRRQEQQHNGYAFLQYNAQWGSQWRSIAALRADYNQLFGSQLSPKIAIIYQARPSLCLSASFGVGFKAPDFRQLYLDFNNNVAGYAVYGSRVMSEMLQNLQTQGQIAALFVDPNTSTNLQAERSRSYQLSAQYRPNTQHSLKLQFFRNDVNNLIETQIVAQNQQGNSIFGYTNLRRIFTQGAEIQYEYHFGKHWQLQTAYQCLFAYDAEALQRVKSGEVFRRDPATLQTTRVSPNEYGGLFQRSRHSANAKIHYQSNHWSASLRAVYRSRFGFADLNGNALLDHSSEYAKGYISLHLCASKNFFQQRLQIQAGIDNLLNYRNPTQLPQIAGRTAFLSLRWQWQKS